MACALSALARALADKGKKEEASRVAAEAVSAVGQKKLNKDYSAYATACALAQGGLTGDVMAVIHQLEDEGQRAAAFIELAISKGVAMKGVGAPLRKSLTACSRCRD